MLIGVAVIGGGFLVGLLVGRWWALAAPLALGIYIYMDGETSRWSNSDIPWGIVGLAYGVWSGVGVVGGLVVRHFANRLARFS